MGRVLRIDTDGTITIKDMELWECHNTFNLGEFVCNGEFNYFYEEGNPTAYEFNPYASALLNKTVMNHVYLFGLWGATQVDLSLQDVTHILTKLYEQKDKIKELQDAYDKSKETITEGFIKDVKNILYNN